MFLVSYRNKETEKITLLITEIDSTLVHIYFQKEITASYHVRWRMGHETRTLTYWEPRDKVNELRNLGVG